MSMNSLLRVLAAGCAAALLAQARGSFEIRLLQGITSYGSKTGSEFRGVVTAPYQSGGRVWLPPGTLVHGRIQNAKSVGIGFVRERAVISLQFDEYELADGRRFPLNARLLRVDNAREEVTSRGEIKGILAASNPQSLVHGLWHTPNPTLVQRSFIGLTGASGRIWTEYSMGPMGAAALLAIRFALFRMPEPEIQLPAGTELRLQVQEVPEEAPSFDVPADVPVAAEFAEWIAAQPHAVNRPNGRLSGDIINIAILGTREQVFAAFRSAGWFEAERLSGKSFSRAYQAYMRQTGYATAPVSKLIYRGEEPTFILQKSFNTMAKRHHIRMWEAEYAGRSVWLGAATHDIGIAFQPSEMTFSHRIHRGIDFERRKVLTDLAFTGCAGPPGYVERPAAARNGKDVSGIFTDGRIAVLALQDCAVSEPSNDTQKQSRSHVMKMARRTVLEGRNYLLRGNAYYWAFRAVRWTHDAPARKSNGVEE